MNNRDIEDGMGFGGLVPSPEEKILTDLYQKGFAAGQKEMKQRAEQLQRDNESLTAAMWIRWEKYRLNHDSEALRLAFAERDEIRKLVTSEQFAAMIDVGEKAFDRLIGGGGNGN